MSLGLLIKQILQEDTIIMSIPNYVSLSDSHLYKLKSLGYETYDLSRITGDRQNVYLMRPLDPIEVIKYEERLRESYDKD